MTSRKEVWRRKIHLGRGAPLARAVAMGPALLVVKSHTIDRTATLIGDRLPVDSALRINMADKCLLHTRPKVRRIS